MDWSNEDVIEFLEAYKLESCIWDPNEKSHNNRQAHDAFAWNRICEKLSFHSTIDTLKRKKDSLMATFRFYSKKKRNSIKSGGKIYEPKWYAFKLMESFLARVYHGTLDELDPEGITEQDNIFLPDIHGDDGFETSTYEIDNKTIDLKNDPWPIKSRNPSKKALHITEVSSTSKKIKKSSIDTNLPENYLDEACNLKQEIAERKNKHEEDECDIYAMLVAKKLKKFKEFDREILMNQIDNLIFQRRMVNLETPDNNT